jgi:5-methyltetrahydropteroyltriglutamate--homocysteine methyltransferase
MRRTRFQSLDATEISKVAEVDQSGQKAIQAFCPGIYARSEELVQATRDLDRGRTTPEEVALQTRRDRDAFVAAQTAAGLDLYSDGLLDWQDLFRPLAERCDGAEARPLTRFLDTNTFYRALIVSGPLRLAEPVPAPDLPAGRWVGTLPSPYALACAVSGRADARALAADVLAPQLEAWADAGAGAVVLQEPFLAGAPADVPELVAALERLPPRVPLVLQLPFGDAAPVLDALLSTSLAGIGIDFYATSLDALPRPFGKWLLAGVIDAQSSALESPREVAEFARRLLELGPSALALGPNGDLQFVPEAIAREKVGRLGSARAELTEASAA